MLFGEGSGDIYAQQVGLLVGELLQLPVINAVSNIQRNGDRIVVERTLEDEVEVIELSLPAVLCVTSDINTPRIPSMKAILLDTCLTVSRTGEPHRSATNRT